MSATDIVKKMVYILDCYESRKPVLANQGQALDGFSALAAFLALARVAKATLKTP